MIHTAFYVNFKINSYIYHRCVYILLTRVLCKQNNVQCKINLAISVFAVLVLSHLYL